MVQKVAKLGIEREAEFLYYVRQAAVWRIPRHVESGRRAGVKIADVGTEFESGYVYFLDRAGDVARVKLAEPRSASRR